MDLINKFKILTYNVGIIHKPIDEVLSNGIKQHDIIWLKHKYKDRFFADPFLVKEDSDSLYILCEELSFWNNKGVISLLVVNKEDFRLVEKKTIIEEPWHLSFPYIINNEYVLPESHKAGKAYLYHLNTSTWEIDSKKVVCEECGFVDPVIIKIDDDKEYLLSTDNLSERLFIYSLDDNEKYKILNKEPVLTDKSRARAAGYSFIYNGELVRPVQDCVERYGRQVRIEKIISFNEKTYETDIIAILNSDLNPPYNETFHTFNLYDNCIIVDGSKDIVRFPVKLIYRFSSRLKK